MDQQTQILKQSIDLSQTMLQGLEHIQALLNDGKFEETMYLFEDVVRAHLSVSKSLINKKEIDVSKINEKSQNIQDSFDKVVKAYETNDKGSVQQILQFTLIPKVKEWHEELDEVYEGSKKH
ncbi:hypothetical protein [Alkalibacillus aidingensis]|uniref:hypothetical protein n=1 Tax=Alkalibacillus aidingensis TaxID=2747607 RepID=UPI0016613EBE|nr:hypothetical protein [Alkalibacillus aidingensis]